jgi:hypothetical protein
MTVADLIRHLQQLPADLPVLVQGYESGWDDILSMRQTEVVAFRSAREWDGVYREASEFQTAGQTALLLQSRRATGEQALAGSDPGL